MALKPKAPSSVTAEHTHDWWRPKKFSLRMKKSSSDNSKEFESHFKKVFGGERWARLREVLLQPSQLLSIANTFTANPVDADELITWLHLAPLTVYARPPSVPLSQSYQPPLFDPNGLKKSVWIEGASILPVILLNLSPGQRVLDMCSSGPKVCLMAQYLFESTTNEASLSSSLTANEPDQSRRMRLEDYLKGYIPATLLGTDRIKVSGRKEGYWQRQESETYDRILIDAPCSSDRHHLQQSLVSRGQIPASAWSLKGIKAVATLQLQLLLAGLKALKVGGRLVYSTCSLSPQENDDVVDLALKRLNMRQEVVSVLKSELGDLEGKFGCERTRYGLIVLPDLKGWGATFCCVITKSLPVKPLASIATLLKLDVPEPDDEEEAQLQGLAVESNEV